MFRLTSTPEFEAKTSHLTPAERDQILTLMSEAHVLDVAFEVYQREQPSEQLLAKLRQMTAKLKAIAAEIDRIDPPSHADRAEREQQEELWALADQIQRRAKTLAAFFGDVTVPARYDRIAQSAARFAMRHIAPGQPVPRIKFFALAPDGHEAATGLFKGPEPDTIHIRAGLDDEELVATAIHEVAHYAHWPSDLSEKTAREAEWELARRYSSEHGA